MEAIGLNTQLVIRAPNQNVEDQVVSCNLNWTIKKLKIHLSDVYPRKPAVKDQKLIYSGRLLHDHLSLKDVFGDDDDQALVHILHLVCKSLSSSSDVPHEMEPSINKNVPEDLTAELDQIKNTPSTSSPIQAFENLRQRFPQQSHAHSVSVYPQFPSMQTSNPVQFTPDVMAQQFAVMQQMYASYIAQYMQRMQISQPPVEPATSETTTVSPPSPPNVNTSETQQNDAQNNVVPPRQENQNVQMNAHGGPVMDEDEDMGNRDWLDWFYLCSRGLVLFMVVYFYSSPERFALVSSLVLLVYAYQALWRIQRQINNRPTPSQQPRQDERNQVEEVPNDSGETVNPNHDFSEEDIQGAREVESVMDGDEPLHVRNQSEINRITGPVWTFISSFFSSLLPEQPAAPVNIN